MHDASSAPLLKSSARRLESQVGKSGSQTAEEHDRVTSSTTARMLRLREVCHRTGLSRTTIWRLERRGEFPAHRQISQNAVGWLEREVSAWIESRGPGECR